MAEIETTNSGSAASQAQVRTEHASRYLQQLCKHWSHKFAVTFDRVARRRTVSGFALHVRRDTGHAHDAHRRAGR